MSAPVDRARIQDRKRNGHHEFRVAPPKIKRMKRERHRMQKEETNALVVVVMRNHNGVDLGHVFERTGRGCGYAFIHPLS
jgi:hypothetical protein